jgi:hypothetical protein
MQINTAKWSPSDALRQRVMGAMEREAQYKNALMKQEQAMRKEVITTEAMRDYNAAAGDPNATREQVYSATQKAIGRIMGVDPEAAKNLAANSANYPKFFPTDQNKTEVEMIWEATAGMKPEERVAQIDRVLTQRKNSGLIASGGPVQVTTGPNKESVYTTPKMLYNATTGKYDIPAPPDIKTVSPQSDAASGKKALQTDVNNAIRATTALRTYINEKGGEKAVQKAAKIFNEYKSATTPEGETLEELYRGFDDKSEEDKKKIAEKALVIKQKKEGKETRDPAEAAAFSDAIRTGNEYEKRRSKYEGEQAVIAQQKKYIDPITFKVMDLTDENAPLGIQEKENLNDPAEWVKIMAGPNAKAKIMKHTNEKDPANLIPAAVEWLHKELAKERNGSSRSTSQRNFVEKP